MEQHKPDINTVERANINKSSKEHRGQADFMICLDLDTTKAY